MRLLPCVDQVMFLEVGQLSEALFAQVALERPLATVHSEMHLQIQRWYIKKEVCCQREHVAVSKQKEIPSRNPRSGSKQLP